MNIQTNTPPVWNNFKGKPAGTPNARRVESLAYQRIHARFAMGDVLHFVRPADSGGLTLGAKHIPGNVGAELLAANLAIRGLLDRRAVLSWDIASCLPHAGRAGRNADGGCKGCSPTRKVDRRLERGGHRAPFRYHDRDCASITNVMQGAGVITYVKKDQPVTELDLTTIGGRLTWARERAKLSQDELAAKAGVSQGTIGNIEAHLRKNPRELLAIAKAANVTAEWLKSGKGRIHPEEAAPKSLSPSSMAWAARYEKLSAAEREKLDLLYRVATTGVRGSSVFGDLDEGDDEAAGGKS